MRFPVALLVVYLFSLLTANAFLARTNIRSMVRCDVSVFRSGGSIVPKLGTLSSPVYGILKPERNFVRRPTVLQKIIAAFVQIIQRWKAGLGLNSASGPGRRKFTNTSPLGNFLARLQYSVSTLVKSPRKMAQLSLAIVGLLMSQRYLRATKSAVTELPFSKFIEVLRDSPERIKALRVSPTSFRYMLDGAGPALTRVVSVDSSLMDKLVKSGVEFSALSSPKNIIGLMVTAGYLYYMWRTTRTMMQGGQGEDGITGKSMDKLRLQAYGDLSFDDVAGQDAAKREVQEVCEMLKDPEKYTRLGARLPSGLLLVGPPGSGKTLLARVTAAEAQVPFYACSASDFVEVFVGRGPARVRKLFKQAAATAPCIVFIDEIDSIGRNRRSATMNSEQETTLNQILTCMDGLDTSNNGVVVMAATNRLELLDPALLRTGRFDRLVQCPLPDKVGRLAILKVHTRKLTLGDTVDLEKLASLTAGCSGADLNTLANEAAIRTVRRAGSAVEQSDFEDALKTFYAARGMSLQSMGEVAAGLLGLQR